MNLLAIETSSAVLSVAVKRTGARLRHATVQGYMKHAEKLLPVIDRLLKKEKLKIGDMDAFLIGRGPGSFTGLRIGFATLKGFLAIRPRPCYGAFSLDVIAAGIHPPPTPGVCKTNTRCLQGAAIEKPSNLEVCLDARRGKLYTRSYRHDGKQWIPCGPLGVLPAEEMKGKLSKANWIAGDGIRKFDPQGLAVTPEKQWVPRASTLIELFEAKHPFLKKLARPKEFLPVYLRRSEPEEKLSERKK